jgi:excisionase family DNA binding protein
MSATPRPFPTRTLITERQLCEHYQLSHRTVNRYVKEGRLKAYRLGPKLVRFDAAEVERALIGTR